MAKKEVVNEEVKEEKKVLFTVRPKMRLNVRKEPSFGDTLYAEPRYVDVEDTVEVLEVKGGWYRIDKGWIMHQGLLEECE